MAELNKDEISKAELAQQADGLYTYIHILGVRRVGGIREKKNVISVVALGELRILLEFLFLRFELCHQISLTPRHKYLKK